MRPGVKAGKGERDGLDLAGHSDLLDCLLFSFGTRLQPLWGLDRIEACRASCHGPRKYESTVMEEYLLIGS
jgi:hypothetical protein